MEWMQRSGRARGAACVAASALLAIGLLGASPAAFAETEDDAPDGSAFRLGDVTIECVTLEDFLAEGADPEEPSEEEGEAEDGTDPAADEGESGEDGDAEGDESPALELAMGVPQTRDYVISNLGETAYVRLATHTLYADLDHNNVGSLIEEPFGAGDEEGDGSEDGDGSEGTEGAEGSAEAQSDEGDGGPTEEGGEGEPGDEEPGDTPAEEEPLWRLADDGWWYRAEPLEAGACVIVHVQVEIPFEEEWTEALNTGAPSEVIETIRVDGVQARNMVIDLEAEQPWGDVQVEVIQDEEPDEGAPEPDEPGTEGKPEDEGTVTV